MSWLRRGSETNQLLAGVFFLLVLGALGLAMIQWSQKDYSDYTEHTTAVVTEVVDRDDDKPGPDEEYYIDYAAEGEQFTGERLNGSWSGDPEVGDTFEMVYPPGRPEDAVTESMTSSSMPKVLLGIGLGLIALGLLICTALTIRFLRRTGRIGSGSRPPEQAPSTPAPVAQDPRTLPVPWPREQLLAHLVRAAEQTPYRVVDLGEEIEVSVDVGDARWATPFRMHGFSSAFVIRLRPLPRTARYRQVETMYDVDWSGGVGRFVGRGRTETGKVWRRTRRVEFGFGADGSFGKQLDVDFNTAGMKDWVQSVIGPSGWRPQLSGEVKGAIAMAVLGGGGAVVALVVLAVLGKLG